MDEYYNLDSKIEALPYNLKEEVNDFVDFLINKANKKSHKFHPVFGSAKDFYKMHEDFDEPVEDFKEYM